MNNKLQYVFATTIKKIRIEKEISQELLAFESKVDRTYISSIELMKRSPSLKCLNNILLALNVTEQEFLIKSIEELKKLNLE